MARKRKIVAPTPDQQSQIENSLTGFVNQITTGNFQQINQTDTLELSLRGYRISNNRQLLSGLYTEHGLVQTLIDQPVDDAFRAGFEILTGQLDPEQIEQLEIYAERNHVTASLIQGLKWARLFGGGAVIIVNDDDPQVPLDIAKLKTNAKIQFKSADMWELYNPTPSVLIEEMEGKLVENPEYYQYYGNKIHNSRVFPLYGKKAPSYIKWSLRGWGMSELERVVASLNSYTKNQSLVFELLDEAKVDVHKITGFNEALLTTAGTNAIANRVQSANMVKNYQNALVMDSKDEYEQKQISFAGLAEIQTQNRQGVAADLKMPMTKIFGISAAGFNSGEDDIENYNSMVEGEIRAKVKFIVVDLLNVCCQVLFGFVPTDLKIKFPPLKMLSIKDEEEVKNLKYNRIISAYQAGLIPAEEAKKAINKANLIPIDIDETIDAEPPIGSDLTATTSTTKTQ